MTQMQFEPPKPLLDKRPWGEETWITDKKPSMVKIITVFPGEANSLQYHHNRDEYWYILSGNGVAVIDDKEVPLSAGVDCFVPRMTKHRMKGGTENLILLELAFGDFDEKDIVRLEDKYGRA
jgi:mannose-6-phosphate isomerase-like protein (cupin superfamily)